MSYSFTPRFVKRVASNDGRVEMTSSSEELEEIITELSENKALMDLMREYISVARKLIVEIPEAKKLGYGK
tara:strand:+ start:231 stop:443 length:213 start_codon:yes stop_codon:yes gene_type:complete